jgi:hypothetical protein
MNAPREKQFALLDEDEGVIESDVNLGEFAVENDLEPEELNAIGRLAVGDDFRMGGGAAPIFLLRRVR